MTNPVTPTGGAGGGMPKWLIILLVVLVVVVIGCCGGIGTCIWWVRNKAPGFVKEQMRQQGVELNLPDASGTAPMPSNFPADIPVYTGAKTIASSASLKETSGTATLTTPDATGDVKAFYDKQMADQGWKEDSNGSSGTDQYYMNYSKDNATAHVNITHGAKQTTLVITYGKK